MELTPAVDKNDVGLSTFRIKCKVPYFDLTFPLPFSLLMHRREAKGKKRNILPFKLFLQEKRVEEEFCLISVFLLDEDASWYYTKCHIY